jgi:excisionase family DNA binding protein
VKTDDGTRLLYSVRECAAALGVSERKVAYLIASGRLESVKLDASRKVTRAQLTRFVASLPTSNEAAAS